LYFNYNSYPEIHKKIREKLAIADIDVDIYS